MAASCKSRERGFILMTMALTAVATIGAVGLSVDIGKMFIAKSETQAYCDAAALSAALKLNGLSTGIAAAQAAVNATTNRWNFGASQVATHTVEFATTLAGPWQTNPSPATGYTFARVRATVPVQLYFLPVVVHQTSQDVSASAVAAQIVMNTFKRGMGPLTAVTTTPGAPNYGLVEGASYDIQWPAYNGTAAGCGLLTPLKCFIRPPCSGESTASLQAVVQYWGSSINGYWGSNNSSEISQEILDMIQLQPVTLGAAITLTSGNKNAIGQILDDRVNQDRAWQDTYNTPSTYRDPTNDHNGRRLIPLPVVQPMAGGTFVVGYGSFLLLSNRNGSGTPDSGFYKAQGGNEPFCAIYMGAYVQGSVDPGASTTTGAYRVALVQ
jgi:Flp pilus assembly protein TadG